MILWNRFNSKRGRCSHDDNNIIGSARKVILNALNFICWQGHDQFELKKTLPSVLILLAILLFGRCVALCQVKVTEVPPPRRTSEDPAIRGDRAELLTSLPKAPPEYRGKGAYGYFGKTRWLPRNSFALKPGESKEVSVSVEEPTFLLVSATWQGSEVPPKLALLQGGSRLTSGKPYRAPPDRGKVTARSEVRTPGKTSVVVRNVGGTLEQIELNVGSLPLRSMR
jgi:hypothetical protein